MQKLKVKKPSILLVYTGGTIGMVKDYESGALKAFNFDLLLQKIPELQQLDCNITTYSFESPIDSSDMCPEHWVTIAQVIKDGYTAYDGFVILHGSDTMSYTGSALSFMLEHLGKPVILTGSQLPIGDLRTDAKENLITAVQLAALWSDNVPVIQEVCLYFEYKLYRANRTSKISAEHFEAFDSPNYPPLLTAGVHLDVHAEVLLNRPNGTFNIHTHLVTDIVVLKMFPGISKHVVTHLLEISSIKGVILETYGSGNSTTAPWFLGAIKTLVSKEIPVVNVTQCIKGSVQMGAYSTSVALKEAGVISGKDITTEAALTKMMFLLGRGVNFIDFKLLFERSLRGELS